MFANSSCERHQYSVIVLEGTSPNKEYLQTAYARTWCLYRLACVSFSFLACRCVVAVLRLKYLNWPGVAVNDDGLLLLKLMRDLDVDEAVSSLAKVDH